MLVHPWDSPIDEQEWRHQLADGHDFGQLVAVYPDRRPVVQPVHFAFDGDRVRFHLARPNPILRALENDPHCVLSIVDDYAYIPGPWRVEGDTPPSSGVPTSHYASVQLSGLAELVDDPAAKAALLQRQLEHFQPTGGTAEVTAHDGPFHRMLKGIRGVIVHVDSVTAKFKYSDNRSVQLQDSVARRLVTRDRPGDRAAAAQQLRRMRLRTEP
ncbi:FMN-binding negative transcriptional regulator [Saccharopolyspora phatthalungensis]|uniref:Transcriptional regulator n=1 Tax=Saccharopolyspora phatthalungensis TaxID=664693 RepID=A0A840Q9U5_9PSEU|nr:FMN-binding negative transcriptional regulator [Saccharopolyspora phatthalungensis]MBB5155428.1 transcriptional regulator [Saccharopolyspora phatthalungensis]